MATRRRRRDDDDDYDEPPWRPRGGPGFFSGCSFGLGMTVALLVLVGILFVCCGGLVLVGLGATDEAAKRQQEQFGPLKGRR